MAGFRLVATAITHDGLVRVHNEDTVAVDDWISAEPMAAPVGIERPVDRPRLCLVADGLGGHAAGEVASRFVALSLVARAAEMEDAGSVALVIRTVHQDLDELAERQPALRGMGTTLAGLAVTPGGIVVFNVGDSRVYAIEDGRLAQLSTDDTPGPKLEDGRTAAFTTPAITQAMGGGFAPEAIEPHVLDRPPRPGARYLVCSDGLSDPVPQERLLALIGPDDRRTVEALVDAALDAGGPDNVSIVLVRIEAG
jgi:PPM family protein phosphatase